MEFYVLRLVVWLPKINKVQFLLAAMYEYIQGLSELADQNNTVTSSSSGNNRKNIYFF
jgi:hypothetical protein